MLRLLPLILVLSIASWGARAATGTSGAETWYVRPAAERDNNGDGLAYARAASAGATVSQGQDYGNRRVKSPPSIGAWEAASGDIAAARTAR